MTKKLSASYIKNLTLCLMPGLFIVPAIASAQPTMDLNELEMNIYGFVMADAIYDFERVDPNWNDTLRVSTVPTKSGTHGNDGEFVVGVRQSRLGVKGNYGDDVSFILEGELYGVGADEGQTTLRVRHAWGSWKGLGMGQTWSNFMDIDIFPNTIDYWGPTGMVFYRNKQVRYSFDMGEDEFSIAFEDPDTALTVGEFRDTDVCDLPTPGSSCGSTADQIYKKYNDLPDLTIRYRMNGDFGHWQLAGIARKLGYERFDPLQDEEEEYGWGINASTSLKFFDNDRLKLQVVYGEGIGNYMNDGGIDIAPSSRNLATTKAEAVPILGIVAYYDHYWNKKWSTSVGYSVNDTDTSDGQADSEFDKGQIAQINLLHYPSDNVMVGTEFIWGEREDVDGRTGTDHRIQFTLKIGFDTGNLMRSK